MKDILDCWPFPFEPRENQITALNWLQNQKARYLLLESPVGSGKSAIGLTFSRWLSQFKSSWYDDDGCEYSMRDSYILTPQRMLQQQYEDSVKGNKKIDMASLYGRSNYICNTHSTTCDIGVELTKCRNCPCDIARDRAKQANDAVMNYALALNSFAYTYNFPPRKLIIFDECHTLEEHLVNFGTVSISKGRSLKYKLPFAIPKHLKDAYVWVRDIYHPKLIAKMLDMKERTQILKENPNLTPKDKKFIKEYATLVKHNGAVNSIMKFDLETMHNEFVLTKDNNSKFEFKRLYGSTPFNLILDGMANKFLFMSSTILNKKGFCEDLGFNPEDTAFLSLGSEFQPKNRKVIYIPQTKMNAKWKDSNNAKGRTRMLATIQTIAEMNKDNSGIIHTGNFQISEWLTDNLKVPQQIYHHNPKSKMDRNTVITAFQTNPAPSILISPSSTEGLDLKDDLGRFAIFCKIPFGYLGDEWIKTRMNISKEWYQRRALIDIIQGGGRVVRSETDWGTVFILDESWGFLFRTTSYMIPPWWKVAYFDKSQ